MLEKTYLHVFVTCDLFFEQRNLLTFAAPKLFSRSTNKQTVKKMTQKDLLLLSEKEEERKEEFSISVNFVIISIIIF